MRRVRFHAHTLTIDRAQPLGPPGAGEVVLRPSHVLLTRIDRHTTAPARTHALTPGVSVLAVVDRVSTAPDRTPAEASTMARAQKLIGHRVVVSPCVPCSTCELCTRGLSTHCPRRTIMGISGRDGGLADELIMPAANLLPVPESMNDEHAVFAFLAGAAAHAAASFRVEGKPYITVLGDGPMALLCVQAMARLNASVRLLGRHESKLSLCERWGIKHRPEHEAGRRNDQDVVIDCTGSPEGPAIATGLLRPRGRLVVKSCVSLGVREPSETATGDSIAPGVMDAIVRNEIEVLGSREGAIGEGLALIQKGHVQTDGLITRRAKLEDAPAILREQRPSEIAALIEIK